MTEVWKDIPDTDGQYQISNLGNVRSTFYYTRSWKQIFRIKNLTPKKNPRGYLHVSILINKRRVSKVIHPIVAKLFIPNPDNKPQVNHIDGDKSNNAVSNLEWVTAKENQRHAILNGLRNPHALVGVKKPRKPVAQYSLDGDLIKVWDSVYDAAEYYGINPKSISICATGHSKSYSDYMWLRLENAVAKNKIAPYTSNRGKRVSVASTTS